MTSYMATIMNIPRNLQAAEAAFASASTSRNVRFIAVAIAVSVAFSVIVYIVSIVRKRKNPWKMRLTIIGTIFGVLPPALIMTLVTAACITVLTDPRIPSKTDLNNACSAAQKALRAAPPDIRKLSIADYRQVLSVKKQVRKICG